MFGLLVVLTRATNKSFADLGWGRPTTRFALVAGIVVGLLYSVFTLSSPVFGSSATEVSLFKAWGAFVGVVGGLVEEMAFRGFVMTELKEAGLPSLAQALVSALVFSLSHGGYGHLGASSSCCLAWDSPSFLGWFWPACIWPDEGVLLRLLLPTG